MMRRPSKLSSALNFLILVCTVSLSGAAAAQSINPYPREVVSVEKLHAWTFETGVEGWTAVNDCTVSGQGGTLRIRSTGGDPYLHSPTVKIPGPMAARIRAKCATAGRGQIFWTTVESPGWSEKRSASFDLMHDGEWRDYVVPLGVRGTLTGLRIDPGTAPGEIQVDSIELQRVTLHPLEIEAVIVGERMVTVHLRNHSDNQFDFSMNNQPGTIKGKQTLPIRLRRPTAPPFARFHILVEPKELPAISRTIFLYRAVAGGTWITRESGGLVLRVAPDGSGARIEREGVLVAVIAPLVHRDGVVPKLKLADQTGPIRFRGGGVAVSVVLEKDEMLISIESDVPCEGPVLRAIGSLEQGLFAGLEYLGKRERSSSKLDIETEEHIRFAPDPLKVTMPLMACVTEHGAAAMTWKDMTLQPVFASPNFFDGTPDHRMALRGKKIDARILVRRVPLEETILWAVNRYGLPPLPKPPRTRNAQWKLCVDSINGPISGDGGWGHCAEPRWARRPHADIASTIWRLSGKPPELTELVAGGSHVRNDTIYFVTGRVDEWLKRKASEIGNIIGQQQPDGSFRYEGEYRRGHYENTASGYCAQKATVLLDYAWLTGGRMAQDAGVRTLEYMKRFRVPRGAQTWELSLHTPDILASAYLVWAYVRGYELTGKEEYLDRARAWALSGVPFVYLWGRYPIMVYATIPVYGATNWRAPNWMGLPVQWCGTVYAYALGLLAPYDKTLDWHRLAEGILIAAEQMQYPDGKLVGCLPDVFELAAQRRAGPSINPCALVSLRLLLEGETDFLSVAADGTHRVAAPFPVTISKGKATVRAKQGVTYQALVDGKRIVDVTSAGTDTISLD